MERNKHSFNRESVSLHDITHAAACIVRERYPDGGQEIVEDFHGPSVFLEGDCEALTTVMVNLIDNAIKYSHGNVHLGLDAQDNRARLVVSDRGIGMTAEEQRQAFDKFYRANQSLDSETSGVGLGLSIVQFIVRAHRGEVTIDSQPGEGSAFTVSLPLSPILTKDSLAV